MISPKMVTERPLPVGGTITLGGGTAISGGGTLNTGGGTPFRLNLTTAKSSRWILRKLLLARSN